jgi:hypothetical protein
MQKLQDLDAQRREEARKKREAEERLGLWEEKYQALLAVSMYYMYV